MVKGIKIPEGHKLRHINKLNPDYQMPGQSEIPPGVINDPYG